MNFKRLVFAALIIGFAAYIPVKGEGEKEGANPVHSSDQDPDYEFKYTVDRFADLKIIRYRIPGFEDLDPKKKELLYYLHEAALAGRDIIYDQNYRHNLQLRKVFELLVRDETQISEGNFSGSLEEYQRFMIYVKRFWFSNGIHHHYSNQKFEPEFSQQFFEDAVRSIDPDKLPLKPGQDVEAMIQDLSQAIFDPNTDQKKVNKNSGEDLVATSAINFYSEDLTQEEVEEYYASLDKVESNQPEYGLNTKLVRQDGQVVAKTWKIDGMYSEAIEKIVYWLEKAITVAENPAQKKAFERLVTYYKTGKVEDWDLYNIAWVNDTESRIDVVNGFIEVYNDPLGYKGSFESVVSFKDMEATKRIETVSREAQWFEELSPIMQEHKKSDVKGITGKVITVVVESGDASPSTPIGINLAE